MRRSYVDSNVFLRYYRNDDAAQADAADHFFRSAVKGEVELYCGPPVFFEIAWVMRSTYKMSNEAILDILESILSIPNMTIFDRELVKGAIDRARAYGQGYADSYIAVVAEKHGLEVATFNRRHFSELKCVLTEL